MSIRCCVSSIFRRFFDSFFVSSNSLFNFSMCRCASSCSCQRQRGSKNRMRGAKGSEYARQRLCPSFDRDRPFESLFDPDTAKAENSLRTHRTNEDEATNQKVFDGQLSHFVEFHKVGIHRARVLYIRVDMRESDGHMSTHHFSVNVAECNLLEIILQRLKVHISCHSIDVDGS